MQNTQAATRSFTVTLESLDPSATAMTFLVSFRVFVDQCSMYRWLVKRGAIVAAAGRRIDPWDAAVPRFPSSAVRETRRRIDDTLVRHQAIALVTSAACGADLLALSSAADLRLRRRVVLPFAPALFRQTSVTDRPGEWGPVFDETTAAASGGWRGLNPRREP